MSLGLSKRAPENPEAERQRNAGHRVQPVREQHRRQDDFTYSDRHCHRITSCSDDGGEPLLAIGRES